MRKIESFAVQYSCMPSCFLDLPLDLGPLKLRNTCAGQPPLTASLTGCCLSVSLGFGTGLALHRTGTARSACAGSCLQALQGSAFSFLALEEASGWPTQPPRRGRPALLSSPRREGAGRGGGRTAREAPSPCVSSAEADVRRPPQRLPSRLTRGACPAPPSDRAGCPAGLSSSPCRPSGDGGSSLPPLSARAHRRRCHGSGEAGSTVARALTLIDVLGRCLQRKHAVTFDPNSAAPASPSDGCLATATRSRHGGVVAARRAGAGGRRRRGAEPGEEGGAGVLAAAPPARLPLRAGLVLGLHPGRARRILHRRGAGPRPRRAPQPPLQVRRPSRASPPLRARDGHLRGEVGPGRLVAGLGEKRRGWGVGGVPSSPGGSLAVPWGAWQGCIKPCSSTASGLCPACRWQLELRGMEPPATSDRGDGDAGQAAEGPFPGGSFSWVWIHWDKCRRCWKIAWRW